MSVYLGSCIWLYLRKHIQMQTYSGQCAVVGVFFRIGDFANSTAKPIQSRTCIQQMGQRRCINGVKCLYGLVKTVLYSQIVKQMFLARYGYGCEGLPPYPLLWERRNYDI